MPEPDAAPRHWLVVAEAWDEDDDGLKVEHSSDCPTDPRDGYEAYTCDVQIEIWNMGLTYYFLHGEAPKDPLDGHADRLAPGRHEIEAWSRCYPAGPWGGEEWDGGLRLVER